MRSDFSFNTAISFNQNDPGSRRSGGSGWTFGLSPVVSAMLSGVVGARGPYVVVCVAGAPTCITVTFFFVCGEILGQSDVVMIGLFVFLLGLKKKSYFTVRSGWAPDFWP